MNLCDGVNFIAVILFIQKELMSKVQQISQDIQLLRKGQSKDLLRQLNP